MAGLCLLHPHHTRWDDLPGVPRGDDSNHLPREQHKSSSNTYTIAREINRGRAVLRLGVFPLHQETNWNCR